MFVNSLLMLALTLLLNAPSFDLQEVFNVLPVDNTSYVEITDNQVPFAGPQSVVTTSIQRPARKTYQRTTVAYTPAESNETAASTIPVEPTEIPEATVPVEPIDAPPALAPDFTDEPEEQAVAPVEKLSTAQRLLQQTYNLLAQYNAAANMKEKKEVLEASNYSLGNDAFRKKLLSDLGGEWEKVEEEVIDATQYQSEKTMYAQVYMSGSSSDFTPVVYATQNADLSGNQWATNLVYDEESNSWMEYIKKHPYNDSRVSYGMTALAKEGALNTLQETMETDENWAKVVVDEVAPEVAETAESLMETEPASETDQTIGTADDHESNADDPATKANTTQAPPADDGATNNEEGAQTTDTEQQ